jgi:DNA-binding MarR family transcriptional regulator
MPVSRLADAPTWLLSRANLRAQGLLAGTLAEHELRPVHYRAMAALEEHGAMSQADLGRHLTLDRKDVTTAVDLLAGRGLVGRTPDEADRRRNVVDLTSAGRELLPRLHAALDEVQHQVLAPLSAREADLLTALLRKLGPDTAQA